MSLLIHQENDSSLTKNLCFKHQSDFVWSKWSMYRIDKILRTILKKNKTKLAFLIIAFLIATPIYISQYTRIYNNSNEREKLTVDGMFLDWQKKFL